MKGSLIDQRALIIKELAQGIELVKQLRTQMLISPTDNCTSTSSREDNQALNHSLLVDKMLSVFDNSISLAKLFNFNEFPQAHADSHHSSMAQSSPDSGDSSRDARVSRKRKKMSPRVQWVRFSPGESVSGLGGALDDGFSWRKYGQKDILKAKHPRGYYRCTHRHAQGCAATKQVQRSDEDPSIYQVIYKGEHTCTQAAHLSQAHKRPNSAQIKTQLQPQQECHTPQSNKQKVTLGLGPDCIPKSEPIEKEDEAQVVGCFSFNVEPGVVVEDMSSSSPELIWPEEALDSDDFLVSPCRFTAFGPGLNVQTSQYELNESASGPSSASNSPNAGDFGFPFDMLPDIDANFFDFEGLLHHI